MDHNIRFDLTGQTFNRWRVVRFAEKDARGKARWLCICLGCGEDKIIDGYNLKSGRSKSCRSCSALVVADRVHATHREIDTVIYKRWTAMKSRCTNPKGKSWKDYGGRGISVCDEWMVDFVAFRDHIGPMPTPLHTVDRINNDGNYEPGNVKWSTQTEQARNRRYSVTKRIIGFKT